MGSLPNLGNSLAEVLSRLGGRAPNGISRFFLELLLGAVLAVCAEKTMRGFITRLARKPLPDAGLRLPLASRIVGRALLDLSALIPLWLVLYGFSTYGVAEDWLPQKATETIFTNVLIWRVAVLIPRIWFRPKDPKLRIAAVDDRDARTLYHTLSAAALAYLLAQSMFGILIAADAPADVIVTAGFFNNLLFTVVDYTAIFVTRRATARWLASLVKDDGSIFAAIKLQLAKYWWAIGVLADTVMSVALAYGMLSGNQNVGGAVVTSLTLVLVLIFLESLYDYLQRPVGATVGATEDHDPGRLRPFDLLARCLRFVTRLLILTAIIEIWMFDVLSVVSPEDASVLGKEIRGAVVTIIISYVTWQIACFYIGRLLSDAGPPAIGAVAGGQPPNAGSRLHTMLPLARMALGITIAVLAVLTVLSRLGVNIAPLIAGASVLGLAVSFGSQTLVRDIISGIFYLFDDAFRVGEYIQSGTYRGTVESFSLRSVKLRHQNGPLYTVPFGVLGAIQNMSRDWAIEKLTIGVTYDTDIDKARKIIKKVGQELMTDPELAVGVIEPLKMQGVQAFGDFAIQLRMKMMTRPGDVQYAARRRALALIKKAFDANGIKFAYPTVQVAGVARAVSVIGPIPRWLKKGSSSQSPRSRRSDATASSRRFKSSLTSSPGPMARLISTMAKKGTRATETITPTRTVPNTPPPPYVGRLSLIDLPWNAPTKIFSTISKTMKTSAKRSERKGTL